MLTSVQSPTATWSRTSPRSIAVLPRLAIIHMAQDMMKTKPDLSSLSPQTRLVAAGREYSEHGFVNPAVYHASTVLYPTVQTLRDRSQKYDYARAGTPTSRARSSGARAEGPS